MKKVFILIICSLLPVAFVTSYAQEVTFNANAPRVVNTGEAFRLSFTLNERPTDLKVPSLADFEVLGGPSTSSSSNMQYINGQMSRSFTYSYTYVLRSRKPGKFTIGAATAKVNDETYTTDPLEIEVVGSSGSNQSSAGQGQANRQQSTAASREELYTRLLVNKRNVYLGEQIIATIKIYSRANLAGFENMEFPSYNGFYTQQIDVPSQISLQRENVDGRIYNTGVLRKNILFPQRTGKITIAPFEIECAIRQEVNSGRSVFDNFFGPSYQTVTKAINSLPVTINVKPLPEKGKPESFNGAIGDFNMTAEADKTELKANEAITFKVRISGTGNIGLTEPAEINFPPNFEVYEPKTSSNIRNTEAGSTGSKTFEYVVIPRYSGTYQVSPVTFSYFNPATERYHTITSKGFSINVARGEDDAEGLLSPATREDVEQIGEDIRYIKTSGIELKKQSEFLAGSWILYLGYLIAALLFTILVIARRNYIRERQNIARLKNKKASAYARKRLKKAARHLKANEREPFFEEVLKALWGYLSDKLTIPVADLSKETADNALANKGVNEETRKQVASLIDTCEFARYSPQHDTGEMDKTYSEATQTIVQLQQQIK